MKILNIIRVGDVVYSIHDPSRTRYTVIGIRDGLLRLSTRESFGFYFTSYSFRKAN